MRTPTFSSALHTERTAVLLGTALGATFSVCFATGLFSHLAYEQPSWWPIGPRPAGLYRITQGVHVAAGIAAVPLLLVKLWVVYPSFWTWPPVRSAAHAVERISLLPLVGASLFLLFSGVGNILRWRPWGFFFTDAHYAAAWIAVGAMVVHIGMKLPATAEALRTRRSDGGADEPGITRRQLLGTAAVASTALTVATLGQTVRPLAALSILAPRDPRVGPQGVPVNRTAAGAGVRDLVSRAGYLDDYRLEVRRSDSPAASLTMAELRSLPVTSARLPIACVEGWSSTAGWRGVAVRDLLQFLDLFPTPAVEVVSLERRGAYRRSHLTDAWLRDPHTLLAYELNGEPLAVDHGFPLRLIAPNRPGVLQTKWVTRLELS